MCYFELRSELNIFSKAPIKVTYFIIFCTDENIGFKPTFLTLTKKRPFCIQKKDLSTSKKDLSETSKMCSEFPKNCGTYSFKHADQEYQLCFRMRLLKPQLKASAIKNMKNRIFSSTIYFHRNYTKISTLAQEDKMKREIFIFSASELKHFRM